MLIKMITLILKRTVWIDNNSLNLQGLKALPFGEGLGGADRSDGYR